MSAPPTNRQSLRTVLGRYPHTEPILTGTLRSADLDFEFVDVTPTHKAFKPMVRERAYDVCEMAIVTYLQAKAYGKPLTLLPAVLLGRFQHHTIVCTAPSGELTPAGLAGRRVGVRAYSQTTGVWVRGILAEDFGMDVDKVRWVTYEDAHVAEYSDPENAERAPAGSKPADMLLAGEVDAAILGRDLPDDPRVRPLLPDPDAAAHDWFERHGVVPINHMVAVTEELSRTRPQAVREIYRLLAEAKRAGPVDEDKPDSIPFGIEAVRPSLDLVIDYAYQQRLIPRRLSVDELFDDTTAALA